MCDLQRDDEQQASFDTRDARALGLATTVRANVISFAFGFHGNASTFSAGRRTVLVASLLMHTACRPPHCMLTLSVMPAIVPMANASSLATSTTNGLCAMVSLAMPIDHADRGGDGSRPGSAISAVPTLQSRGQGPRRLQRHAKHMVQRVTMRVTALASLSPQSLSSALKTPALTRIQARHTETRPLLTFARLGRRGVEPS